MPIDPGRNPARSGPSLLAHNTGTPSTTARTYDTLTLPTPNAAPPRATVMPAQGNDPALDNTEVTPAQNDESLAGGQARALQSWRTRPSADEGRPDERPKDMVRAAATGEAAALHLKP
ncbi:hypothetical protein GCM10027569_62870 [Flindersiella endophytica]